MPESGKLAPTMCPTGLPGSARSQLELGEWAPRVSASRDPTPNWQLFEIDRSRKVDCLRRHTDDHHFWSIIMLVVTFAAFLLVVCVATKALFFFLHDSPIP